MAESRSFQSFAASVPYYPRLLWRGRKGLESVAQGNAAAAIMLWKNLADEGDIEALYQIGLLHETGFGAAKNIDTAITYIVSAATQWHRRAIKWLKRTASNGTARAQFELATIYRYGRGVDPSLRRAFKFMKSAAGLGWAEAQVELARMYLHGQLYASWMCSILRLFGSIPKLDPEKALYWLRVAAQQGDTKGKYILGLAYTGLDGFTQDHKAAIRLLEEAAEDGLVMAQLSMARCLWTGELGPQDRAAAVRWFDMGVAQADNRSSSEVALTLADAYQEGWCVDIDIVETCYWTAIAFRENPDWRRRFVKKLFKKMDGGQLERAKDRMKSTSGFRSRGKWRDF